jgi:putative membrane protein
LNVLDLWLAIGHHLIIFALFGIPAAELVLVARGISLDVAKLSRVDSWYGALAGAIVIVGFSRAIFAAKGWAYYSHNAFFWAKIATFVLVALLSVPPTMQYLKWRRNGEAPSPTDVGRVRRFCTRRFSCLRSCRSSPPPWRAATANSNPSDSFHSLGLSSPQATQSFSKEVHYANVSPSSRRVDRDRSARRVLEHRTYVAHAG